MSRDRLGKFVRQLHHVIAVPAQTEISDGCLLERFARGGDESAFATLMRRHGGMVLRVCRRVLRDEMDVEDTFQATFLLLVRKASSIRKRESVGSWLHGVAYRLAMHTRADGARRQLKEHVVTKPAAAEPGHVAAWRELQDVLDEELQWLPEKYRLPLVLCYLEGETHEEVAGRLRWPIGTVKGRLARAREMLRMRLARRGMTLASGAFAAALAAHTSSAAAPPALAAATYQSALGTLGGQIANVSLHAATLAENMARAWFIAKLKIVLTLSLGASLLAAGGGFMFWKERHGKPNPESKPILSPVARVVPVAERPATDAYGDPLPIGVSARLGTTRFRAGRSLYTFTYSPDGRLLAAPGETAVFVWDSATGKELLRLEGHRGRVFPVQFSSDGQMLATGGADHTIRLWDVATGKVVRRLEGHTGAVAGLLWSEDGKTIVSGSMDKSIRFWDTATGESRFRLETEPETPLPRVHFLKALSGDGRTLVTEDDQSLIHVWDTERRTETRRLDQAAKPPERAAVSSDATTVAVSVRGKSFVQLWDVASGNLIATCRGHLSEIPSLCFSRDGKTLATVSSDRTIRLWDSATGEELRKFGIDHGQTEGLTFSPDGRTLASGHEGTIRQWDIASGDEIQRSTGHRAAVRSLGFTPDSQTVISAGRDNVVRLWDAATGKLIDAWNGDVKGDATSVSMSPDGLAMACGGSRDAVLYARDSKTGRELQRWQAHRPARSAIETIASAFAADGQTIITGASDRKVALWSVPTGEMLRTFAADNTEVHSVAFASNVDVVAAGCRDGTVYVWQASSAEIRHRIQAGNDPVRSIAFSPDGKSLACAIGRHFSSSAGTIAVFDVVTGQLAYTLSGHQIRTHCIGYSPDGTLLASGGADCKVRLWNLESRAELAELDGHHGAVTSLAFSPDGKRLATGSTDTAILVWSLDRFNPRRGLPPSTDPGQPTNGVSKKG